MAAFPYNHHPFLFDPLFFPNPDSKMSAFSEQPNTTPSFFQFHQPHPDISAAVSVHESSCLEHNNNNNSTPQVGLSNMTNKHSTDSSSVVLDKLESGEQVTQKRKHSHGSSLNSAQSQDTREVKGKKQKKMNNGGMKKVRAGDKKKVISEEAPSGYIHVRARRGQATDSHSLAERVRREKISVRMKLLQALVPGCDKVTGKALMLDEIINYVQSLQNQVEFLSLKLASVNPMFYDFGMDLDTFMVRPERLSSMESPLPNVQQCSPTHPTAFSDTTNTFPTANSYPLLDNSASLLFQQGQMQSILSQNNGQVLWDVDGQREKITSQSGFTNLCSFH